MSPRILYFTDDRISWDCAAALLLNESLPRGPTVLGEVTQMPKSSIARTVPVLRGRRRQRFVFQHCSQVFNCPQVDDKPGQTAYAAWAKIIHDYSGRSLTYPDKDRLVALAAVAQRFASVFGEDYYAGHFGIHMPFDLLWIVDDTKSRRQRTRRRPTWSWASIDSGVIASLRYIPRYESAMARVEGVHISLVDPAHKYGQASDGGLLMRCMLIHSTLLDRRMPCKSREVWIVQTREDPSFVIWVWLDEPEKPVPVSIDLAVLIEVTLGKEYSGIILSKHSEEAYIRYGAWFIPGQEGNVPIGTFIKNATLSDHILVKIV